MKTTRGKLYYCGGDDDEFVPNCQLRAEVEQAGAKWVIVLTCCGQKFFDNSRISVDGSHTHSECIICKKLYCLNGQCDAGAANDTR